MIISRDTNPQRDFYYLGSLVIQAMSKKEGTKMDFFDLFNAINRQENFSINSYILTLDWLYLMDVIDIPENGNIVKCF